MFEKFDESARAVAVTAQEEARSLRHAAIGGEHLLLGIATEAPLLLDVAVGALREQVIVRSGTGDAPSPAQMPFTATATKALELAADEAADRGHDAVRPVHLLLALLAVDDRARSLVDGLDRSLDEIGDAASRETSRAPADVHQALREGHAVPVTLGDGLPIGDLGNPRTDARVLLAMLVAGGRAAELLRGHGLDEAAIRRLAPDV